MRPKGLLAVGLLVSILSVGASSFSPGPVPPARIVDVSNAEDADADLPPGMAWMIDKETYLRLRNEHISRLRGIEPGYLLDPGLRTEAVRQMDRQMALQSLRRELAPNTPEAAAWTPLGPAPLSNGQTMQFPTTAAVTGPATSIAVDPGNSNKVYLGTAQGGVWRSTDGGASWTPIFDAGQSLSIGAIALAPSDPTKLYVGTGEGNNSADSFFGVGVYRIDSVDTSPVLVGPINPQITTGTTIQVTTNCFTGRSISKVVVHPSDPATIFVSTAFGLGGIGANFLSFSSPPLGLLGLYRSTNATAAAGLVTFSKLVVTTQGSLDIPGTGNTDITDIVLEPGNPNNLLAAVRGSTAPGGGVFLSTTALAATPTFTQT